MRKLGEQPRRADVAPLPGIGTPPWVFTQSHMPGISGASGFLWVSLEENFTLVDWVMLKEEEVVREGFTLN